MITPQKKWAFIKGSFESVRNKGVVSRSEAFSRGILNTHKLWTMKQYNADIIMWSNEQQRHTNTFHCSQFLM